MLTIVVCKQPKLTDEYTLFVGWFAFEQTKKLENYLGGEGSLGYETNAVRNWRRDLGLQIGCGLEEYAKTFA